MTAKWTETTETTVPARVEREETEYELWTRRRSAYRCATEPATPTEIGRGLQALEPAERAEALTAAGVEPTQPATPEELAAVVAALSFDEHRRVLSALGYGAAPKRTPEALGAELAALDCCEFLRAARAAGIVEARRLPRSSSPPLSVGGVPVAWSEIRVSGGGLPLSPLAEARAELGELHRERDQAQAALREAQRENIATARAADRWRERATAAEYAEREATAAADRAQAALAEARAELAVAQRDRDAALLTLQAIRTERDNALVGRNQARAERDEARRHLCNERNGAAGLRDALATMKRGRDGARAKLAEVTQARDVAHAQLVTELERVRELATERDRVRIERDQARAEARDVRNTVTTLYGAGPAEPRDVVATAGGRGCALLTEHDGSTVKVTAGVGYLGVRGAVVKVTGSVWFENVLVAAHRAGVLL